MRRSWRGEHRALDVHVRVDEARQKHSALCFDSFFCGFRTEPVDEAVFNKYCLRIERSREDVEHAGVENGKVMDLRLRALLGVLYENFWMQSF